MLSGFFVGAAGFEPTTSSTRTKRASRTAPRPVTARESNAKDQRLQVSNRRDPGLRTLTLSAAHALRYPFATLGEAMSEQKPKTLTQVMRQITRAVLDPLGAALHRLGVHPDTITILGLFVVALACVFIGAGHLQLGGLILLLGLPLDAVDGAVARAMKREGRFGAVLDSTLDRYADGFIFAALGYYFAVQDRMDFFVLAMAGLLGSQLVSYVRARADGVGVHTEIGLFTRLERVSMILVMLLIPQIVEVGILILALGTNFTALQRLYHVYVTLKNRGI